MLAILVSVALSSCSVLSMAKGLFGGSSSNSGVQVSGVKVGDNKDQSTKEIAGKKTSAGNVNGNLTGGDTTEYSGKIGSVVNKSIPFWVVFLVGLLGLIINPTAVVRRWVKLLRNINAN